MTQDNVCKSNEMDTSPEALLRQVRDRDTEIWVLLQRTRLLNSSVFKSRGVDVDDHYLESQRVGIGSFGALKERLTAVCGCQKKAQALLDKAAPRLPPRSSSPVVSTTPDAYTKALSFLLSAPSPQNPPGGGGGAPAPDPLPPSSSPRRRSSRSPSTSALTEEKHSGAGPTAAPVPDREGGGGGGSSSDVSVSTSGGGYRNFLERLTRPESKGFVKAIRLFLFSVLGNGGSVNPASGRPRAAALDGRRRETDEVEVYGSSFLVQRCAEFFLAMQNAMGVHPSWAELGYDSLVACREHLERFVMTKMHPLALGVKLDGAMDAVISARLSALQFLTPHDLNVGVYARDDTVLALAQEELRKMGSGRCPGDVVMRVERCCDTIFSLVDQGRRVKRREAGDPGSAWRPELDPAGTADDFLPVLIYVVLRARVPRLHSMCEYVQAFHSPIALMSRPGYVFIALRSAVSFLMDINGAAVGMPEQEFRLRSLGMPVALDARR